MVRRQSGSKSRVDSFEAKGKIAGKKVTVRRLGVVGRSIDGGFSVRGAIYEAVKSTGTLDRLPITGYLLPASFDVDGLGFRFSFSVGYVADGKGKRYGVTAMEAGGGDPVSTLTRPEARSVDVSRITEAALVRLAIEATAVEGYAYAPGVVVDPETGNVVGRVIVGDTAPEAPLAIAGATIRNGRIVELDTKPDVSLRSRVGRSVRESDARLITGRRPPGRQRGEPLTDADLRLVARLYREAYKNPEIVSGIPNYVAARLIDETDGRLSYGESWVRKQAVEARRRGFLKEGKRNKKGGKR